MNLRTKLVLAGTVTASLAVPIGIAAAADDPADHHSTAPASAPACGVDLFGDQFVRTELFFGLSRPRGRITESQFGRFVDEEVTPRFPDGLTVLSGLGQFRLESGEIIEEKSKVLVILHGGDDVASKELEEIRSEYIEQFDQQSVLRTDEASCVSF
jgi:Protein of unknown function (DUF3574)